MSGIHLLKPLIRFSKIRALVKTALFISVMLVSGFKLSLKVKMTRF